jgi:hypothetical protein
MYLCGYVAPWLCSYVAMWLYGYVVMWLCGYVAKWSLSVFYFQAGTANATHHDRPLARVWSPPLIGEPIGWWTAEPKRLPAACLLPLRFPRSFAALTRRRLTLPACSELSRTLLTTSSPASSLKGGLLLPPSAETPPIAPATWLERGLILLSLCFGAPAVPPLPSSPSCLGVRPLRRSRPTGCKELPAIRRSSGVLRRSAPVSAPA